MTEREKAVERYKNCCDNYRSGLRCIIFTALCSSLMIIGAAAIIADLNISGDAAVYIFFNIAFLTAFVSSIKTTLMWKRKRDDAFIDCL